MDFEPSLSPRFVTYIRDYLMDRGIDPEPILLQSGIDSGKDEEFDCPLPVHKVATLFELAAQQANDTLIGVNLARQYHYEASSLIILAMLAAPSVEEGVKLLHKYDRYVDSGIETSFDINDSVAALAARLLIPDDVKGDQINEYLMAFLMQALSTATRKRVPVKQVWFYHSCDQNAQALETFFGAPVKFAQTANKFIFDRSYLKEKFLSSNALLYDILIKAMKTYFWATSEQNRFVDAVCREVMRVASDEAASAKTIAARLTVSPRTLRRRLANEGYSFQEAKNLARQNRAKYYLAQTTMSLAEIAFELGYSELSAFSRAFRGWIGETPQNYRANYHLYMN